MSEIDRAADANPPAGLRVNNDSRNLLNAIALWESVRNTTWDLTWSFFIFLTEYSQGTENLLSTAMENLARVQQRSLCPPGNPPDPYAEEVARRFRIDVVHDQEALQGASLDRVRENFRALVRNLNLSEDDEKPFKSPTRHFICFALDEDKVKELANLAFSDDELEENNTFLECKLPAVDIFWERPKATTSSYRGVRDISVNSFDYTYLLLAGRDTTLEEFTE